LARLDLLILAESELGSSLLSSARRPALSDSRPCVMETKKRHVSDDSEVSLPKKRALTNAQGSPTPHVNVNGLNSDEPKDDNLEVFNITFGYFKAS
jgi:hypothetical protein